jgi:S-DNA-T family DNA segregation ATPase FtsK/SpoIIIE
MTTSDRIRKKPVKKVTKSSSAKKPAAKRKMTKGRKPTGAGTGEWLKDMAKSAFRREVLGVTLIVLGLFFTAAFLIDGGAFLGELGQFAAQSLFGAVGMFLAPVAVIAAFLILINRLTASLAIGTGLLVLAVATTLASSLPANGRFEASLYSGSGGLVGSGIYTAVSVAGGAVGAAIALFVLYVLGISLVTGVTSSAAVEGVESIAEKISTGWTGFRAGRQKRKLQETKTEKSRKLETKAAPARRSSMRVITSDIDGEKCNGVQDLHPELRDIDDTSPIGAPDFEDTSFAEKPDNIVVPKKKESGGINLRPDSTSADYQPPPLSLLGLGVGNPEHDTEGTSQRLTEALGDLGVEATVVRAVTGPRVTRYELRLGSGVKVGKVRNLQQDIAYALAATEVRILAPIPGKSAVGVEVPNTRAAKVTLGDVFSEYPEANDWALPVALGKDISGRGVFFDLSEMPHLLVAGTTGSGKSVMLNGLLTSLLLTTDPRHVKMVLIDPKRVELSQFAHIPHLITPVVTDVKKAANALVWAVSEMERRYEVLEKAGVRSLEGYNARNEDRTIPFVVVVIDELADLMMTSGAKVEDAIIRLAQKARAVGIHLVVATQRPSVDVITGMIKANIPSRIAFAVSSQVDSRVILDSPGAEALLGMGDMLFKPVSAMRSSRVQGAFISENEVDTVVNATREAAQGRVEAVHVPEVTTPKQEPKESEEPEDDLLNDAATFVVSTQQASVSAVQRRFRVGYSRAGRIIDSLERKGVVGPYEGSKARSVVASELDLGQIFGDGEEDEPPQDDFNDTNESPTRL